MKDYIEKVKEKYWKKTKNKRAHVKLATESEVELIAQIAWEVMKYEKDE